ncbi:MAG: porin [Neisseriaceae bacterium]|nr:porin [Neisseriaceae bacterium]
MKKTLIALALAALPVASMAEVTLFGTIKGGLEVTKVKGVKNTITNANDWDSSIGFKGEEDLGNGLKAIWQLQSTAGINAANKRNDRSNTLTSFIGLDAGTFGKIRAGNLPDAIKSDMEDLNLDDSGHGVRDLGNWEIGSRYTGIRYDSANFGGFSFNALYSPEDNTRYEELESPKVHGFEQDFGGSNIPAAVNGATDNHWLASVGLNYSIAGFFAKYGYIHQKNSIGHDMNANAHRVMAGYDANNLFVGLGYQYTSGMKGITNTELAKDDAGNPLIGGKCRFDDVDGVICEDALVTQTQTHKLKTQEVAVAAAYRIGNVVPRLSYVHGFAQKAGNDKIPDSKYHQVVLGADYHLSKRTTVIASLGWAKEGANAYGTEYAVAPSLDATFDPATATVNSVYSGGLIGAVMNDDGTQKTKEQAYSFGLGLRHKF